MSSTTIELLLAIVGSGAISSLVVYIFLTAKREATVHQHDTDICNIKEEIGNISEEIDALKDALSNVKNNTNERLIKIETQIVNIDVKITDMAKDTKLILMQGKYNGK